jgi:flagellar FliJ protein
MKFEFAFDSLLNHKRTLEDVARRDWAAAQRRVDDATEELNRFYDQVEDARQRANRIEIEGGRRSPDLVMIDEFLIGQKVRIERQRAMIRDLMQEAERLQELLVQAAKERRTLEKLKEKRHEEYKKIRKKMEMKTVDDLVTMRFAKQSETTKE